MSEMTGTCSQCGSQLTSGGCPRCTTTIQSIPTFQSGHLCCYHPTNNYYTTNPPQRIASCCHCGQQQGMVIMHEAPPAIPPGHGPYYPRNF